MVRLHLCPKITYEQWLLDGAQAIRDRLKPYAKLHRGEALLARVRQALCTALAPYLYRNDLCGLTATAREGEGPSAWLCEGPVPVEPGVEHNPLYLKADGEFAELIEALARSIWTDLRDCVAEPLGDRAYVGLSDALRRWLERSLTAYDTCGLSLYCAEGEVRVLPETTSRS
jgi:hypothetical protein